MARDSFRQKVYDSEHEIDFIGRHAEGSVDFYGSTLELPAARKFGDLAGVQTYVNQVWGLNPVREKYPSWRKSAPLVVPRGNESKAHYSPSDHRIHIPEHRGSNHSWAMTETVVLHETAHSLTPGEGHGTPFVLCYLDLLEWCMGGTWRLLMTRALDSRGVPLS